MLMLGVPEIYRAFIYLNVLIVLTQGKYMWEDLGMRPIYLGILAFPLALTLLHMIAVGEPELIKEERHLWLAGFVCLSILLLQKKYIHLLRPYFEITILGMLLTYCITQAIAVLLFDRPYGTTKNPHYLALYSALGIPAALYLIITMQRRWRLILVPILLSLASFVLDSWSRPAWIALISTGLLVLLFLDNKKRLLSGLLILIIPIMLFLSNLGGFGDRLTDLALNISKEERVVIWQDAWKMQKSSHLTQWLVGHGLDSYEKDFRSFSTLHDLVDFNSPHNSFMDVLYTSGLLGLGLCLWLYYWVYSNLFQRAKTNWDQRRISILLMAIFTINSLFIMITIPFFAHYNILVLALIVGLMLYKEHDQKHEA